MLATDLNSREIGFAMAIGILIASFVVSTLLVPAVTTLLGTKAWWPRGRAHPAAELTPRVDTPLHEAA
jgi:RND superfamily putative drug exporter